MQTVCKRHMNTLCYYCTLLIISSLCRLVRLKERCIYTLRLHSSVSMGHFRQRHERKDSVVMNVNTEYVSDIHKCEKLFTIKCCTHLCISIFFCTFAAVLQNAGIIYLRIEYLKLRSRLKKKQNNSKLLKRLLY